MKKDTMYRFGAFLTTMMMTAEANASTNANTMISNITGRTTNIVQFMMIGAYLVGIAFAITGLLKVKAAVENPGKEQVKDGLFRLLIGGGLLALGTVLDTMFGTVSSTNAYSIQNLDAFSSGNLSGR